MRWGRYLAVAVLVATAVGWRLVNDSLQLVPNLELLTSVAVVGAMFLGRWGVLALPVAAVFISDLFIANTNILWFTWSSWAIFGLGLWGIRRWADRPLRFISAGFLAGVVGSTFFFLWTNFGVWLLGHGSMQMYPRTWGGLIDCYVAGVPFYRNMLVGNMILVPMVVGLALAVRHVWQSVEVEDGREQGAAQAES